MIGMTPRQAELFAFIELRTKPEGVPPTYAEMALHLNARSKGTVTRLLVELADKGFIRRYARRARSIEILPRDRCAHCGHAIGSDACLLAARAAKVSYSRTPLNAARQ